MLSFLEHLNEVNSSLLLRRINNERVFDIQYNGKPNKLGVKLSILGKTTDDVVFLFNKLSDYLFKNDIAFKFATIKRINHQDPIQSKRFLQYMYQIVWNWMM